MKKPFTYFKFLIVFCFLIILTFTESRAQTTCTVSNETPNAIIAGDKDWPSITQTFTACATKKLVSLELDHAGATNVDVVYQIQVSGANASTQTYFLTCNSGKRTIFFDNEDFFMTEGAEYTINIAVSSIDPNNNNNYKFRYNDDPDSYSGGAMNVNGDTNGDLYFVITQEVNSDPTDISLTDNSGDFTQLNENNSTGPYAEIRTTDADVNDNHSYTLSGPDAGNFSVVDLSGDIYLSVDASFDHETQPEVSFTLTSEDGFGGSYSEDFVITINNENEDPFDIYFEGNQTSQQVNTFENNQVGDSIASFITQDPDVNDTHTYSLAGTDASSFTMDGNTLKAATVFDFETKSQYSIEVITTDGSGRTYAETFQINITDALDYEANGHVARFEFTDGILTDDINQLLFFPYEVQGSGKTQFTETPDLTSDRFDVADRALAFRSNTPIAAVNTFLYLLTDFSINFWFSLAAEIPEGQDQYLIDANYENTQIGPGGFVIGVNDNENIFVRFYDNETGANTITFDETSTARLNPDRWYMGTLIVESGVAKFILNRQEIIQGTPTKIVQTNRFSLGARGANEEFIGKIDDINFYQSALNDTQVEEFYTEGGFGTNSDPTDIALDNLTVTEELDSGTVVGNLSTTDPDGGDVHTYSLDGDDAGSFTIVDNVLQTTEPFDWETQSRYNINITSTDDNGGSFTKSFEIEVLPKTNTPPQVCVISQPSSNATLQESFVNGVRQTFKACENGSLQSVALYLGSTVPGEMTVRVSGSGVNVQTTKSVSAGVNAFIFDQEATLTAGASYTVQITANQNYSLQLSNTNVYADGAVFTWVTGIGYAEGRGDLRFTVRLKEANQNPTDISLSSTSVPENNQVGDLVGTFSTNDPNTGDIHLYTITGADATSFEIDANKLIAAEVFDQAQKSTYEISITTDDRRGGTFSKDFTISVTGPNDLPTDISLSNLNIDEDLPVNTDIGQLSTVDPNDNTHTYSLSGEDASSFNLNTISEESGPATYLRSSEVFDFEVKSSYSITITTTDDQNGSYSKDFTITINDTQENRAPTDINLSATNVDEGQTLIGTISTVDADENDQHNYSVNGQDGNIFYINNGNQLFSNNVLDFEARSTYEIGITTDDQRGGTFNKTFTIIVNDINEAPTQISISNNSINENEPVGTSVLTFSTIDQDNGDSHTYSISGSDASSFTLEGNRLKTAEVFDFESKSYYSFQVTSTDQGGATFTSNVGISILDVEETSNAPTDITLSSTEIVENMETGSEIGTITVTDLDEGDAHAFTLSGIDAESFSISGSSLISNAVFDFETQSEYSIEITASDLDGLSFTKAFIVTIIDADETILSIRDKVSVQVYPNPASEYIYINTDNDVFETITIRNLNGKAILKMDYNNSDNQISVNHLRKGIYLLELSGNNHTTTQKLVID